MFAALPITGYHIATHPVLPLSLSLSPRLPARTREEKESFNLNILIRFVINCEITIW